MDPLDVWDVDVVGGGVVGAAFIAPLRVSDVSFLEGIGVVAVVHATVMVARASANMRAARLNPRRTRLPLTSVTIPVQTRLSMPQPNALQAVCPHPISTWEL
jgi:hypothetical protein